jgi:hypothetical protein
MAALPPPRRIVTSNLPLPAALGSIEGAEPAVQVISETITPISEINGQAARSTVFTHNIIPTSNSGLQEFFPDLASFQANSSRDITPKEIAGGGIVLPQGANIRFNDLAPGGTVPMVSSFCPILKTTPS